MTKLKVIAVFGTRPECIKMAPLIQVLRAADEIELITCFSGQHKEMVLPLIDFFGIKVDYELDVMRPNHSLAGVNALVLDKMQDLIAQTSPDLVLVQGDTTTAYAAAITAFYNKVKIGHVEAGLRTDDIRAPFPEEFNRRAISLVADYHYASTPRASKNLIKEGIDHSKIWMTGNTVIDALYLTRDKVQEAQDSTLNKYDWFTSENRFILVTGHRRENFGQGFQNICESLKVTAQNHPDVHIVYPVHLNPNVHGVVHNLLGGIENIHLIAPLEYPYFVQLMAKCYLILTDSGGIQEEAPSFNKPVLVMRESTERQEAVEAGVSKLVGTDKSLIISEISKLLNSQEYYQSFVTAKNPFGDGKASKRILNSLRQ
jgi:UDP-N-acetylglucosamine 2-epimerase (non-hydrolysing)